MANDPYQTLGVARDASPDDIRSAYRKLAKKFHPDLNRDDKAAEERFKAISGAYDIVGDVDKRARFDRGEIGADGEPRAPEPPPGFRQRAYGGGGRGYAPGGGASAPGMDDIGVDDIFADLFRGAGGGGPNMRAQRGRDVSYALTVDFVDAITGTQQRVSLPDGRSLDVRVPPGLDDGQTLRLRGQGAEGYGGPAGDALIEVRVRPHPFFRREDENVTVDLPVSLKEAVLGAKVPCPTVSGTVTVTVPPRSDSGRVLRLRGRGVPATNGRAAGDQLVTLRITAADADDALAAFLRDWSPDNPQDPRAALDL